MRCSVVIPLYNKAPYVLRALRSVLGQTLQGFEVIVIDDGSTDGGGDLVKQVPDPHVRLIRQENAGASAARNRGIAEARAELVAFLDADDEWKPKFLETILRLRAAFPQCGAYATAYERREPDGRTLRPRFRELPAPPWDGIIANYFRTALGPAPISSSSVAVPRVVLEQLGCFPVGVKRGEDLDTWMKIALLYPIAFSYSYQAIYHREAAGRACVVYEPEGESCLVRIAQPAVKQGRVPPHLLDDLMEYAAKRDLSVAANCLRRGRRSMALTLLEACKGTRVFRGRWVWLWFWATMPKVVSQAAWKAKRALSR